MMFISGYCHITNDTLRVNSKTILTKNNSSTNNFEKQVYKFLAIDYPKFYKMDVLSKLAILGSEALKKSIPSISFYPDEQIALLFSNAVSSADTDQHFRKSYAEEGTPSPALFVYTLPHILSGELAIKNRWYGENLFSIYPEFNPTFFMDFCRIHFAKTSEACLCGWIDSLNGNTDAFLFFVEKIDSQKTNLQLNIETLTALYKS